MVINREHGSGGRETGRRIAERTGMEFYDSCVLAEAAATRGLPCDLLAAFDERVMKRRLFDLSIIAGSDLDTYSLPFRMCGAIAEVITAANEGASTDVEPNVARVVEVDGVDRRHATGHIARMDKARARFQQFFTQTTFGDPRAYDLCLNSARLGFEGCVETILTTTQTGGSQPG